MSKKHLGITFDIHGGGKDLVFPHHTNEIAQSEGCHGEKMARYWMHNGFVNVEADASAGESLQNVSADLVDEIVDDDGNKIRVVKMSKSLGNFFTIRDVLTRFTGEALRMLLLSTHYRSPIAFSARLVEEAERRVQYLYETRKRVASFLAKNTADDGPSLEFVFSKPGQPFRPRQDFVEAMEDDFNTPRAMAVLQELLKIANLLVTGREKEWISEKLKPGIRACLLREWETVLRSFCEVFAVGRADPSMFLQNQRALRVRVKGLDEAHIQHLLSSRASAKESKDFARADGVRAELLQMGVEVRDTPDGVEWAIV